MVNGVTPAALHNPEQIGNIYFPTGLMPKLAGLAGEFAIARSVRAHAVVHSVSQTWVQIGRNPLAALGNIAPNIGSIVAAEKFPQRQPHRHLPHVPGAEFQWRGEPGLPFRQVCSIQGNSVDGGNQQYDQSHRTDPVRESLQAAELAGRRPAHQCAQRRGNERLQRILYRRQAVDVQLRGEPVLRVHRGAAARNSARLPRATPCWWHRRS